MWNNCGWYQQDVIVMMSAPPNHTQKPVLACWLRCRWFIVVAASWAQRSNNFSRKSCFEGFREIIRG
jgi:hypothetical protein